MSNKSPLNRKLVWTDLIWLWGWAFAFPVTLIYWLLKRDKK